MEKFRHGHIYNLDMKFAQQFLDSGIAVSLDRKNMGSSPYNKAMHIKENKKARRNVKKKKQKK